MSVEKQGKHLHGHVKRVIAGGPAFNPCRDHLEDNMTFLPYKECKFTGTCDLIGAVVKESNYMSMHLRLYLRSQQCLHAELRIHGPIPAVRGKSLACFFWNRLPEKLISLAWPNA